ncbi:MBL fold metallo-hydrolase [Chitinophaga caseinilytica]|uniref:MBL fold metallo-hydrolase n=1 Tax=Chitinophaga caseinilytica TaxID=2267521 RepID=UPI003C2C813D
MFEIRCFTVNPFQENTYVLINEEKQCIIIDPGFYYQEERDGFLRFMAENELTVARLLNTHCHLDHIFSNRLVQKMFGKGPEIHRLDQVVLDRSPQSGMMYNIPFEPSPEPVGYLEEGDKVTLGDDELEVILTPGHSPGSISFYSAKQHFVIAGDVLFKQSVGRSDFPGGNFETLASSIREKLYKLPDETVVYSGHGPETTIGFEKVHNPFVPEDPSTRLA